jgi:hypothetical protein
MKHPWKWCSTEVLAQKREEPVGQTALVYLLRWSYLVDHTPLGGGNQSYGVLGWTEKYQRVPAWHGISFCITDIEPGRKGKTAKQITLHHLIPR